MNCDFFKCSNLDRKALSSGSKQRSTHYHQAVCRLGGWESGGSVSRREAPSFEIVLLLSKKGIDVTAQQEGCHKNVDGRRPMFQSGIP